MSDQLIQNDILPTEDNTFSLGSASKPWKLYANTINGVAPEEMGGGGGLPEVSSDDNGKMITVNDGDYAFQKFNTTLITKTVSKNGTYNASSDSADGYSVFIVNIGTDGTPGRCARSLGVASLSVDLELEYSPSAEGELVVTE